MVVVGIAILHGFSMVAQIPVQAGSSSEPCCWFMVLPGWDFMHILLLSCALPAARSRSKVLAGGVGG